MSGVENCTVFLLIFGVLLQVCEEKHRFETLMDYFKNYDEFHIDFMVGAHFTLLFFLCRVTVGLLEQLMTCL